MIKRPVRPIVFAFRGKRMASPIKPKPIAAITCEKRTEKCMSKKTAKLLIVKLTTMSQIPLVIRKRLAALTSRLPLMDRKADTPDKKTKVGAHRWVIQRVKKSPGVVVCKLVALSVIEDAPKRSRQ